MHNYKLSNIKFSSKFLATKHLIKCGYVTTTPEAVVFLNKILTEGVVANIWQKGIMDECFSFDSEEILSEEEISLKKLEEKQSEFIKEAQEWHNGLTPLEKEYVEILNRYRPCSG